MIYAIQMAAVLKARLFFYHATGRVIPHVADNKQFEAYREAYLAEHRAHLQKNVRAVYHELGIEVLAEQAELVVQEGDFLYQVHDAIREHQIDLVVMGTHGATGLKRWFLGSNAAEVFENAACPVLTVPAGFRYSPIKRIGYATDLITVTDDFRQLVDFARQFKAQLTLFHVHPIFPEQVNLARMDKAALLSELNARFGYDQIGLELIRTEDDNELEDGIELFVKQFAPSLLVMFSRDRTWFDRMFDPSNTKELVMTAQVPLLAFKQ